MYPIAYVFAWLIYRLESSHAAAWRVKKRS